MSRNSGLKNNTFSAILEKYTENENAIENYEEVLNKMGIFG